MSHHMIPVARYYLLLLLNCWYCHVYSCRVNCISGYMPTRSICSRMVNGTWSGRVILSPCRPTILLVILGARVIMVFPFPWDSHEVSHSYAHLYLVGLCTVIKPIWWSILSISFCWLLDSGHWLHVFALLWAIYKGPLVLYCKLVRYSFSFTTLLRVVEISLSEPEYMYSSHEVGFRLVASRLYNKSTK